jgi:CelD/BcsL family acetyltransferase involved in cellulose biosynthesis
MSDPGFIASEPQLYPRHYIDMSVGYEGYLANFSAKTRATLARKTRKLAAASGGTLDIRAFHRPEDLPAFFAEALPLARRTYQAKLLNASLPDNDLFGNKAFELAKSGNLRAYILYLSGRAIAYLYLPVDGDVLVYAYLGYDQSHAQFSPGTVLQMHALEALFAERRFRFFDFTEGDGLHKALFGTHQADCATVFILRSKVRNHLLLRQHRAFNAIVGQAGALAQRLGIKSALRKLLRP